MRRAEHDEEEEETPFGAYMWIEGDSLAPPCQSDSDVVKRIVDIAQLDGSDVLIDLGCGDGRICIAAAVHFGARARGVEIEDFLIHQFEQAIEKHHVDHLVSISHGDLMQENLDDATVIVTYLLPEALEQLRPKFSELLQSQGRKLRIICNTWGIPGIEPDERHDAGAYGNVSLLVYKSAALKCH